MKHIEIYTDGACSGNPGPGGWGAILRFRTAQKVYEKELSGGEMRRVMIVRALINNPKLLLLDEPTGDLDPEHTLIVVEMLREAANRGAAVLMVTHDSESARSADCTYTMDAGSLH